MSGAADSSSRGDGHPLVEARGLARRRPGNDGWLLEDVSLAIRPGDRLAVSGPSGSGKTLLLRALALLDPWDGGELLWRGARLAHQRIPRFRAAVVYLHQRPALLESSVRAALERPFALGIHRGRRFDPARIEPWLTRLGRDPSFLDKQARDLSGGEIQITSLLRALQLDPSVLLLDEPTAALDRQTTLAAEELLEEWLAQGPDARALVWVSHDADQARRVAGTTIRLASGRIAPCS